MTRNPKSRPVTHIRDVLGGIIKTCRRESDAEITKIRHLWGTMLSQTITEYAQPALLKNGTLMVHVKSPALIHQLRFQAKSIITALNQGLGEHRVNEIKFKIGEF